MKNYVNMKKILVRSLKTGTNRFSPGHQDSTPKPGLSRKNRGRLNNCNLHPYCYDPEKDASGSSGSDSDTNADECNEEEKVSPNNAEINKTEHKDWCIC